MIGEHIELVVLDVEGETIRIGIKAPKHIEVHRKEIYLQIQEANKAAQSTIGIMDLIKIVGAIKKQKDNAE
ncbi:carbon storage regulator [Paenibacillus sedimenti]